MGEPIKKWLNSAEATEYLGLPSVKALHQAVRRDSIPRYRWGKRIRFKVSDLDALMVLDDRCAGDSESGKLDVDSIIRDVMAG